MRRITLTVVALLLFSTFSVITTQVETQNNYAKEWDKTFGGSNNDGAHSIVQTLDGGYVVVGVTQSFGAGGYDIWLVKTDSYGNMEWNKTYGGAMNDHVTGWSSVVQTSDEGYAIVGHTYSFGAGSADFWLIKTDEFGNMQWDKTYGGTSYDVAWSLMQTSDGGFVLVGQTYSFGSGWCNAWLVKTDEFGNMEWNKTYGRKNYDYALSFVQTSDGGYALAGRTASKQSFGDGDFWLIKTNSSGNVQWDKTYGGTGEETAHSVVQTTDEGYALAGLTNSFGAGSFDTWLVKTDYNGEMEWNQTYGGTNIDWAHSMVQTPDEGYALAGAVSIGTGAADFWLVKVDSTGNMQWNKTYSGTNEDIAYSLVQTSDGGYALAGFTESFDAGNRDFWLIKLSAPTVPAPDFEISVSPSFQIVNPGDSGSYTVTLTSLSGFNSSVSLSILQPLPNDTTASFDPPSVTPTSNSTLTITTSSTTPIGAYTITINGISEDITHSTTVTLIVGKIIGESPFWMQWWFWTITALGITTVAFGVSTTKYRQKFHAVKKTTERLPPTVPSKKYKVCPNCGAQLPEDSVFCGKCGTSLK